MFAPAQQRRLALVLVVGGALVAIAWLVWMATRDHRINFLTRIAPGEWIVYPRPPETVGNVAVDLTAEFRRGFSLEKVPATAALAVRAFKDCALTLNGVPLVIRPDANHNWKQPQTVDVKGLLRAGENKLIVTVTNRLGPPALWLALAMDGTTLASDEQWEVSLAGAVWRPARLASRPLEPGRGHLLWGGEKTWASLRARWREFLFFTALAAALVIGGGRWLGSRTQPESAGDAKPASFPPAVVVFACVAVWVMLAAHNVGLLPRGIGYDCGTHLDYVNYIAERHALPLANEGASMYNPPLYYLVSALTLGALSLSTADYGGVAVLRALTLAMGITHFLLVFASLRLLFPRRTSLHLVGLVLAAFVPMHLYLSHYPTNETTLALLVTATLYLCLRALRDEQPSTARHACLGLCLGAALLTKMTAVLAVPAVFGALAWRLAEKGERKPRVWLRTVGVAALACVAVAGWHYVRAWIHFGNPLIGASDAESGHVWWQDEGYRTAGYFFRFGESLIRPLFSVFHGFGDGIYSTLWGDGMCGGTAGLDYRAPWNYDFMAAGYLLSLWPTIAVLAGAALLLWKFLREPAAEWFLLFALAGGLAFAFVYMALKVPCYSQLKAFYGLLALLPFCAFGAAGWDWFACRGKWVGTAAAVLLGVWALNNVAAYWVRARSATTQIMLGRSYSGDGRNAEAAQRFAVAVQMEPTNADARSFLAAALVQIGQPTEALRQAEQSVKEHPDNAMCHLNLAVILSQLGQMDRAVAHAQRAVELAPENADAHRALATRLALAGRYSEAIVACRLGLGIAPTSPEFHLTLGSALAQMAKMATVLNAPAAEPTGLTDRPITPADSLQMIAEAIEHCRVAVKLHPTWPEALNNLAWLLAMHPNPKLRDSAEAVHLAERACQLSGYRRIPMLNTLAAVYAEAGRFPEAAGQARKSLALAETTGEQRLVERCRRMIESFEAGRVFRE